MMPDTFLPAISHKHPLSSEVHFTGKTDHTAKTQGIDEASRLRKIRQVAEEFEATFIARMLAPMFQGISPDPLFGGGHGEEIYQSMMIDEMAKLTVKTGGIGLADHVVRHMIEQQEHP